MVVARRANPTIQILDPRPEDTPEELGVSSPMSSLAGKTIGLLENRKYHADAFLLELQKVLEQDYGARQVVYAAKFTFSMPAPRKRLTLWWRSAMPWFTALPIEAPARRGVSTTRSSPKPGACPRSASSPAPLPAPPRPGLAPWVCPACGLSCCPAPWPPAPWPKCSKWPTNTPPK